MWPWGHLAVSYLCYVGSIEVRSQDEQTLPTLLALAIGSQFPDMIDKPLAWGLGVLPSGRALAHSLLTTALIVWVVAWFGRRRRREDLTFAFLLGYVTHTLADIEPKLLGGLLRGDFDQLQWGSYLLWPLLSPPPYENDSSFVEVFSSMELDVYVVVQFVLFGAAILVWLGTGATGVSELRRRLRHQFRLGS